MTTYAFAPLEDGAFLFATDNGTLYVVSIEHHSYHFDGNNFLANSGNTFEIAFTCNGKRTRDEAVSATIIKILSSNIIAKGPTACFYYICDTLDGQGKARAKLFDKWMPELARHVSDLHHICFVVEAFDEEYHVGLLISNDHPNKEQYISEFEQWIMDNYTKNAS